MLDAKLVQRVYDETRDAQFLVLKGLANGWYHALQVDATHPEIAAAKARAQCLLEDFVAHDQWYSAHPDVTVQELFAQRFGSEDLGECLQRARVVVAGTVPSEDAYIAALELAKLQAYSAIFRKLRDRFPAGTTEP